jgi:peptide/nickel transport system substrate-binding protein
MKRRDLLLATTAGALLPMTSLRQAIAQSRAQTLLILQETGPNSLDLHAPGANRPTQPLAMAVFDRLLGYGNTTAPEGHQVYDYFKLEPELAESWEVAPDGASVVFTLRAGVAFHSGNPVTAEDVKWSLDRAVTLPGFPKSQMNAGSLLEPSQFEALDARRVKVSWIRPDKLLMPNLGTAIPCIYDSRLLREKATASDPWAVEFARANASGSGAFRVATWQPGQQTVLERYPGWRNGAVTNVQRIIIREVPAAATRRALIERGDADVLLDLPPKDFSELIQARRATVQPTPMQYAWRFLGMNTKTRPFDDKRVRQAVAWAVPYDQIFRAALFERGRPLWGGTPEAMDATWPTPSPYRTDLDRARALLAEAGFPQGFETTFHLDIAQATLHEPIGLLLQEGLGRVGIRVNLERVPAGQLRGRLAQKSLPFFVEDFGAWFADPDYFFFLAYHGQNGVWNSASYQDEEMTRMIDTARTERDGAAYTALVRRMFAKAFEDVPFIPLVQPFQDVAVKQGVTGHRYMFHRQLEYRFFNKA